MRITLKNLVVDGGDGSETVLCDGPAKAISTWMGPDGLSFDGEIEAQVQPFLRANSVKVWNRKNHRIAVSFRCRRDCGTPDAAEAYIVQFYATCVRGTQLVISSGIRTLRINNAVLKTLKLTHIGVLVQADYSLIGGSIS
jgi:hypothetical protein